MIRYETYTSELQLPLIIPLIEKDLSEPYSIYTYRYFLLNFPNLSFLVFDNDKCIGVIISKLDQHKTWTRGYIGMLAVDETYRGKGIGSKLVKMTVSAMIEMGISECVMETETSNTSAIGLYESLGFIKEKRLFRYYLNGSNAFRLKLCIKPTS